VDRAQKQRYVVAIFDVHMDMQNAKERRFQSETKELPCDTTGLAVWQALNEMLA